MNYTVQIGDSLFKIANQFNLSVDDIKNINHLSSNSLWVGQVLQIPQIKQYTTYTVVSGDSFWKIATSYHISVDELKKLNPLLLTLHAGDQLKVPVNENITPPPNTNTVADVIYIVKSGDTLDIIAWIFDTTTLSIKQLNNLKNETIFIGQTLKIKKNNAPSTSNTNPPQTTNNQNNTPVPAKKENIIYTVVLGDSLWKIANKYQITIAQLSEWNKLPANPSIFPGQTLIVGTQQVSNTNTNTNTNNNNTNTNNNPSVLISAFNISDSVGEKGKNYAADVLKIQQQLVKAGFLSPASFNLENSSLYESTKTISINLLSKTLSAIEAFQLQVVNVPFPNRTVKPNDDTHHFLQTVSPPPTNAQLATYEINRKEITVKQKECSTILGNGLSNAVGDTGFGNNPTDVDKIQKCLVLLGWLDANHLEKPIGVAPVPISKLNKTITSLKKFQEKRVEWWLNKPELAGSSQYRSGVVQNNDLTFKIFQKYTEFEVSFSSIFNPQQKEIAIFRNCSRSFATVDINGISYAGKVKIENLPIQEFKDLGLNPIESKALQYVSEHEGNCDAINTYDKANFSYGFIQFAGAAVNGGLANVLAILKQKKPSIFENRFKKYGIDVEYSIKEGNINLANLVVTDLNTEKLIRRTAADIFIKNNISLIGIFIRAAYDRDVQRAQLEAAKNSYVTPALAINLDLNLPNINWANVPISQIIRSEMGITVLIDLTVNKWTAKTAAYFEQAITNIAIENEISALNSIKNIADIKILKKIAEIANKNGDTIAYDRTTNILNSNLSSYKSVV